MGRPRLLLGVVPGVEQLQEDPLRPAEIVRIGGIDLAVPVVAEAEHLDLPAEVVDVLLRGDARMRAGLDGVLLGGQAEGVPAHRMQHVEAAHAPVAAQDVGGGVAFGMADVQPGPAGIGEHVEDVELRLVGEIGRAEGLVLQPVILPAPLDDLGVVTRHARLSTSRQGSRKAGPIRRAGICVILSKGGRVLDSCRGIPGRWTSARRKRFAKQAALRAAHAAQRSKRCVLPLTPLRCVRSSERTTHTGCGMPSLIQDIASSNSLSSK